MKLAFTTLGCPNWEMDTIITKAVEYGYQGVDFRGYLDRLDIYNLDEFTTQLEETKLKFKDASLEIPCFSSSVRLFTNSSEELASFINELEHYGELCQHFKTPYIRVFGGGIGLTSRTEAIETAVHNLHHMLKVARKYDVTLLLETHDDWTDSRYVAEIYNRIDSAHFKVLWDVHHPYRTLQEDPERTMDTIGDFVRYTHWKDSYPTDQTEKGFQLCLLGKGDVPLQRMYALLKERNYDGYYTLEWEKKWWPDIEEPEVAFKEYVTFMKGLSNQSDSK
ncbi:sugar phosphate isomerase/epimerase [Pullulanibacillus sp. KACC 23026]|uniref:sugar phosphate isomerase/epimerase family protein n=1 Tax=Pullulanibacillus sp. KACC 23026 TaxID=3028315 RepID=UPI0023AF3940|nr:sugar phosphate isomerase/epimerase family protein [Pullulanibacillus sp. KACC 23026]WEG13694.1 sugar phosphate isomerase/epimerase [Pullulanibacillus sp. KACC 23026]